ncbi:hypothetical protein ABE073_04790 [Lederbergia citrisecunda]|uniref:hypothetical protein n=1 Tax=Lederbergia citrisecunda TaxID=2833583 RepID=UPI003D29F69E
MKNKKKVLIGGILAVSIFSVGLFGGTALGNSSWSTSVVNSANSLLVKAGQDKTKQLATTTDVGKQMQQLMQPEIEAQQRELERLLEEYYQMKLAGLTETDEFKAVEGQIDAIKRALLNRYKNEIDSIFE